MNKIKITFLGLSKLIIAPLVFIFGCIYYSFTKKTTNLTHQSYVRLYCMTSGYISYFLTSLIILFHNKLKKKKIFNNPINDTIIKDLNENGYVVLKNKLDQNLVNDLIGLTKYLKCINDQLSKSTEKVIFNKSIHKLSTYSYLENELLKSPTVIQVVNYLKKLSISENYFRSKPYLISVNMWWSTVGVKADSFAAQNYHFDLDGIKWLKYFIYVTDVNVNNGPHIYVEGTHKPLSKPYKFLKKGYARISDNEIENFYPQKKIKKIIGDKGTIIIGDTSCYHKGLVPKNDARLIFEVSFANSFFGSSIVNKKKLSQLN